MREVRMGMGMKQLWVRCMFYTAALQLESLRGNETAVGEMDVLYCSVAVGKLEGE
jgi:hypothetical protein